MSRFPTKDSDFGTSDVLLGAAAGLAGGVPMGVVLHFGTGILPYVGGIAGEPSIVVGWIVHLVMSAVAGVSFALFVSIPVFYEITRSVAGCVIMGILTGFGIATVIVGILLPLLAEFTGSPRSELAFPFGPIPGPALETMIGAGVFALAHIAYGVVLGTVYAYARGVRSDELTPTQDPSQR